MLIKDNFLFTHRFFATKYLKQKKKKTKKQKQKTIFTQGFPSKHIE